MQVDPACFPPQISNSTLHHILILNPLLILSIASISILPTRNFMFTVKSIENGISKRFFGTMAMMKAAVMHEAGT
jgi:hypothetical protein